MDQSLAVFSRVDRLLCNQSVGNVLLDQCLPPAIAGDADEYILMEGGLSLLSKYNSSTEGIPLSTLNVWLGNQFNLLVE